MIARPFDVSPLGHRVRVLAIEPAVSDLPRLSTSRIERPSVVSGRRSRRVGLHLLCAITAVIALVASAAVAARIAGEQPGMVATTFARPAAASPSDVVARIAPPAAVAPPARVKPTVTPHAVKKSTSSRAGAKSRRHR